MSSLSGIFIALFLTIANPQTNDQPPSLTDFRIQLKWTKTENLAAIQESPLYRWYNGMRAFAYVCSSDSAAENLKSFQSSRPVVKLPAGNETAEAAGCVCLSGFNSPWGESTAGGRPLAPNSFAGGWSPREIRHPSGTIKIDPATAEFSAINYFRQALRTLGVKSIGDARLLITLWRKGSSIVHDGVSEMVAAQIVDLFQFTSQDAEPYKFAIDTKDFLGASPSAQAQFEGQFIVVNVAETSPFYDLNVPLEIYRPSVIRGLLQKSKTETITLQDYLSIGNIYFSFQRESIWSKLSEKLSRIDLNSEEFKAFLSNDRVKRVVQLPVNDALNVYLYYFRANLEDVAMRLVSLEEKLKADRTNTVIIDGRSTLSTEAQEQLARYQLNRALIRDSIEVFDLVRGAGRAYLDEVLR